MTSEKAIQGDKVLRNYFKLFCCIFITSLLLLSSCKSSDSDEVIVLGDRGPRTDYRGLDTGDMNQDGLVDIVVASESFNSRDDNPNLGYIDVFLQESSTVFELMTPRAF